MPCQLANAAPPTVATDVAALPGLTDLWANTLGDPRVVVAVLDGPVDVSHPEFAGADLTVLESGCSAAARQGSAAEHGTHVASVIFGQHVGLVQGIAPHCRGVVVPVFSDGPDGRVLPCSQVQLARAITQAVQFANDNSAAAIVINVSGGQFTPSGEAHPLLADVVRECDPNKVLIVAAAGNQGCDCLHIPGAIPSVLAVGAMNTSGEPLDFSNWGSAYREQGVLAPGENILGAAAGGGVAMHSGTSYATPIAAGLAALLLSLQLAHGRPVSAQEVRLGILQSALGCTHQQVSDCRRLLAGRLNVRGATSSILQGICNMNATAEPLVANDTPGPEVAAVAPQEFNPRPPAEVAALDVGGPDGRNDNGFLIEPSDCGCGCGGGNGNAPAAPQKVFALGRLYFDYQTRARRQYFAQSMRKALPAAQFRSIDDEETLYEYLRGPDKKEKDERYTILDERRFPARAEVASLLWILQINDNPIYAIAPSGPFAHEIHDLLVSFLKDQFGAEKAQRISLPGIIVGKATLFSGETVPVVQPDIRGMFSWKTSALRQAAQTLASGPTKGGDARGAANQDVLDKAAADLEAFLTE